MPDQNPSEDKRDKTFSKFLIIQYFIFCLIILSIVQISFFNFKTNSFARQILSAFLDGKRAPVRAHLEIDRFFEKIPHDGNVFVRFKGFEHGKAKGNEGFITLAYYRSVYSLYPRRVFVGEPTEVINQGRDILKANFNPSKKWLSSHNIHSVITFVLEPRGKIQVRINENKNLR